MIKTAIILTVHNRRDITLQGLRSLHQSIETSKKHSAFDIYMTDDECSDGTGEAVASEFPKVKIIKGNGNLYWCGGMRKAWQEAIDSGTEYDYFMWFNDDTCLYINALEELLNASSEKKDQCIIIGSTQNTEHTAITYGGYTKERKYVIPNGHLQLVHHFNGNIVLIPRHVYQILGNLDDYFTHSNGDIDYGLRANEAGISSFIVGDYLGDCNRHDSLDKWCNPCVPFKERWTALHKPNGMPPKEKFYLQRKHQNIFVASFHFFTIYLRCLIPQLWKLKK